MKNNIVLCGFMGCGKTTIGKALAKALSFSFVDSDAVIEQTAGKTITEIFAEHGEAYFRGIEKSIIKSLSQQKGLVIATGGGVMLKSENAEALKKTGSVIFLDVSKDEVLKRLENDTTRPLLQRPDRENAISELLIKRRPCYLDAADITVNADTCVETVTEEILKQLKNI